MIRDSLSDLPFLPMPRGEINGYRALKSWRYYPYRNTRIPLEQYTAEGGYYYNFFSDPGKNVFLNIGASGLMGYETVNGGKDCSLTVPS